MLSLPSLLVQVGQRSVEEKVLHGHLRSFAWEPIERSRIMLVGNKGFVARIDGEEIIALDSGTQRNLRAISFNPADGTVLIVGNAGTILLWDEEKFYGINSSTSENLRAVAWDAHGRMALIAGNRGTLLKYFDKKIKTVGNCRANLRRISWNPHVQRALIVSSCFAEEFIPSPNLFSYQGDTEVIVPLNERRVDLIGVDWHPNGQSALVVGFDVVWHNGVISSYDEGRLSQIAFQSRHVYPVATAWNSKGSLAAIATAAVEPEIGRGVIYLWNGHVLRQIYADSKFFFSAVSWNDEVLVALASTATRTYNC